VPDFAALRRAMVADLRDREITDERVLEAMGRVPRELFVLPSERNLAYADRPLSIGQGQTISQPAMVAIMCQTTAVNEGERVLDVGSGSGYQAAVLAELRGEVHTIERIPELAALARENLRAAGYERVATHVGDGSLGLPDHAPYDAVVVAAAAPSAPAALYQQLAPGGRLVVPVGGPDGQRLELVVKSPEGPARVSTVPCRFVPLVGAEGFPAV
jgi:protein-L-isoaspartate(D-aspartate) O-methyltransferase